jgi:hypothetical protein
VEVLQVNKGGEGGLILEVVEELGKYILTSFSIRLDALRGGQMAREAQEAETNKRVERLLLEGLESGGDDLEADQAFWSDLKTEAAAFRSVRCGHEDRRPARGSARHPVSSRLLH